MQPSDDVRLLTTEALRSMTTDAADAAAGVLVSNIRLLGFLAAVEARFQLICKFATEITEAHGYFDNRDSETSRSGLLRV